MGILVVIVNYRTGDMAVQCLRSLVPERLDVPDLKAVVVENDSGDGSEGIIRNAIETEGWGDWASLIVSSRNVGFAAGNNLAIRPALREEIVPELFLLLNPDALVYPGAVRALVDFMDRTPAAGIAGPLTDIGHEGNPLQTAFRFHSVPGSFSEGIRLGLVSRVLARWEVAPELEAREHEADWVSGGCMLIRREVFDAIGLLDEGYFIYFEEQDFARRAHRSGWPSWFAPEGRILHYAGQASGITGESAEVTRVPRYWFESRKRYFVKHHGYAYAFLADVAWVSGHLLWTLRRLLTRRPDPTPPHFFRDFVRFNLLPGGDLP